MKKSVKFVVPTVTCDTENEVRWKISPSGGVVNNVDQICKILDFHHAPWIFNIEYTRDVFYFSALVL